VTHFRAASRQPSLQYRWRTFRSSRHTCTNSCTSAARGARAFRSTLHRSHASKTNHNHNA
jgi:hypothetical protein